MQDLIDAANFELWKLPTVIAKTTLSEPTIYRLMKQDLFPKPIRIGQRAVAWKSSEVEAFIAARVRSDVGNTEAFYTVAKDVA